MAGDVIGKFGEVDASGLADLRKKFLWLSWLGWIAKLDGLIFILITPPYDSVRYMCLALP